MVGTDFSGAMLAVARDQPPLKGVAPIEYLEAPAAPLPVRDESFDVVTRQPSPVASTVADLPDVDRRRLWDAAGERLKPLRHADGLQTEMVSNIATARK